MLILGCTIFFTYSFFSKKTSLTDTFDAKATFAKLDTTNNADDFLEIEKMIGDAMKQYGTKAGFLLIDEGERQGVISNDQCHGLLHYVGHAAYSETPYDYDAILSVVEGTTCLGGYLHGVEAEIVLQSSNVIEEVQNFCRYQKEKQVNPGPCFHGVGHAAAELYNYDVPKALALCDSLAGGPEDDLTNCYRGIFSEVGNVVVGYDGHTGLGIDTIPIAGLDPKDPFSYCNTFETKHRSSCKSQLMKIFLTGDTSTWFDSCLNKALDTQTRNICVNIASGVLVRGELSFEDTVILPKTINLFDIDTQKVAVLGSAEAFSGYFNDNSTKDWHTFCTSFTNSKVKEYCEITLKNVDENNTAPWMERTDIR